MMKSTKCQHHYIYLTWDKKRNMFYCGKRSTNIPIEQDEYYGSGDIINRILKKSTPQEIKERFTKIILEVTSTYDTNILAEKHWVNEVFNAPKNPLFYNIADAGYGGYMMRGLSDKKRKEIYYRVGLSNSGKVLSAETRNKISVSRKGKGRNKRSIETRQNISKSKVGEKNPFYGRTHSKEVLQKIREHSTGRNNPRATFVKVVDKDNNELFRGIRKEVEQWCESSGICSGPYVKKMLHKNIVFHPRYNMKNSPNSKQYDGIRFEYIKSQG